MGVSQDITAVDWDHALNVSAELMQGGNIRLSADRRTFWLSDQFLQPPSPLLLSARGFKTRQASKTSAAETGADEGNDGAKMSFKEVLKQLNISSSEREKVKIALAAATAAAGKKSTTEPEEKETDVQVLQAASVGC